MIEWFLNLRDINLVYIYQTTNKMTSAAFNKPITVVELNKAIESNSQLGLTLKNFCEKVFTPLKWTDYAKILAPNKTEYLDAYHNMIRHDRGFTENACYNLLKPFQSRLIQTGLFLKTVVSNSELGDDVKQALCDYYRIPYSEVGLAIQVNAPSANIASAMTGTGTKPRSIGDYSKRWLTPAGNGLANDVLEEVLKETFSNRDLRQKIANDPIFKSLAIESTIWEFLTQKSQHACLVELVFLCCAFNKIELNSIWYSLPQFDVEKYKSECERIFSMIDEQLSISDLLGCSTEDELLVKIGFGNPQKVVPIFTSKDVFPSDTVRGQNSALASNIILLVKQNRQHMDTNPNLKKELVVLFAKTSEKAIDIYTMKTECLQRIENTITGSVATFTPDIEAINRVQRTQQAKDQAQSLEGFLRGLPEVDDAQVAKCMNTCNEQDVDLKMLLDLSEQDLRNLEITFGMAKKIFAAAQKLKNMC